MSISTSTISSTQPTTSSTTQSSSTTTPNDVLGKDAFLQLLVTQLKNQDPSQPVDNSQFISEMAQFTSLEQTQNMSDAITQFVNSQNGSALGTSATMIGKTITWTPSSNSTTGTSNSTPQSGVVTAVSLNNGQVTYMVGNTAVDPTTITMVESSSPDAASSTASTTNNTTSGSLA